MRIFLILSKWFAILFVAGASLAIICFSGAILYLLPNLPKVDAIHDIQLQTPLRVFSNDNKLIAEFGNQRRIALRRSDIPTLFIQAVLAAEDDRFYEHQGVDVAGLTRAAIELIKLGHIRSGGSTITMQVAKNFYLSHDRKFIRKFNEIILALQIEQKLSKDEILELYLNKIFLGNRAYGIAAAAEVYYGKKVDELTLAQMAMIAGLPKAPSIYNPLANAERAQLRRDWILKRMLRLNFINQNDYDDAVAQPITAEHHGLSSDVDAEYFAEMVRRKMIKKFGVEAYRSGYVVHTTLDSEDQLAASQAVNQGLLEYTERHGYFGPAAHIELTPKTDLELIWTEELAAVKRTSALKLGIVRAISDDVAQIYLDNGKNIQLTLEGIQWASPYIEVDKTGPKPTQMTDTLKIGDVIYLRQIQKQAADKQTTEKQAAEKVWQLSQIPKVQGSMTSLDTHTGAIRSLVGGFDFRLSKFNRATQGRRQAGSCFKPFVYGATLSHGFTAASIINDAPIVYDDTSQGTAWRPRNAGEQFKGPIRIRQALYESRNLVSIRLTQQLGVENVIDFASKIGIPQSQLQNNLSIALGTSQLTTTELAQGYSVIGNGGYKVKPYFIETIKDSRGNIVFEASPEVACGDDCNTNLYSDFAPAPRVIDERDQFILNSMLQDVIKKGTGKEARALNRDDIAGKTGTTNEQKDAWFTGYHPNIATSVWVGFDRPSTLGRREFGGRAALPIWIDYMEHALKDQPEVLFPQPEGVVSVPIDPETGERALETQRNSIIEFFKEESAPAEWSKENPAPPANMQNESSTLESLF